MTVRDEAHRLIDELPEERLDDVFRALQQAWKEALAPPARRRSFRTTAAFEGDPDLGARAKDLAHERWDDRHGE